MNGLKSKEYININLTILKKKKRAYLYLAKHTVITNIDFDSCPHHMAYFEKKVYSNQ